MTPEAKQNILRLVIKNAPTNPEDWTDLELEDFVACCLEDVTHAALLMEKYYAIEKRKVEEGGLRQYTD